ncbi:MAG: hypothetical protein ACLQIJ_11685, partial [Polyangia bacterium]
MALDREFGATAIAMALGATKGLVRPTGGPWGKLVVGHRGGEDRMTRNACRNCRAEAHLNRGKTGLTTQENECEKGKLRLRENRRSALVLERSQRGGNSILDDLQLCPFEALERFRRVGGVGDNHGNQGVQVDLPVQGGVQGIEIDPGETVGKVDVVVWRQAVDEEVGVPVHQGAGGLELAGLALDQGAPRVVQLGLGG